MKTLKKVDLNLISELILSILILLMGVIVMIFKTFGLIEVVLYGSVLFYISAVFSTILYFVGRKEGDYELLLQSLINIITATFMFVFKEDNPAMILGAGMTIFTILTIANRGVKVLQLRREDNYIWIVKFIVTFLIGFLGMLTTFNLFNNVTVQTLMFGYYFISLGFMTGVESTINIFITNDKFKKILSKIVVDETDKKLERIKEKRVQEIVNKKEETPKETKPKQKEIKNTEKKQTKTNKTEKVKTETKKAEKPKKEIKIENKKQEKPEAEKNKTKAKTKVEAETKKEVKSETTKKPGRPKKVTTEVEKKKTGRPKKVN